MILILGVRELRSESKNVSLLLTSPCSLTSFFASPEVHTSSPVPSRLKPGSLDWSSSPLKHRPVPKTCVLSCSSKSQIFCNSLSGRKRKISVFLQAYISCLPQAKYSAYSHPSAFLCTLYHYETHFSSVQFSSVAQSCPTLCDPTNRSTPGLPVHHQLPEFTQTCVHRVSDAIQPSHPWSSPSSPASQHHSLFQ